MQLGRIRGIMLQFSVLVNGAAPETMDLSTVHLVGTDDVALRAELTYRDGVLSCRKRAAGPAGVALLWDVPGCGRFLLESARLMERTKPYLLQLELVRGRLMRLFQKFEEWGIYEAPGGQAFIDAYDDVRQFLLEGIKAPTLEQAAVCGDRALTACLELSESVTLFHADALLQRRRESDAFGNETFGCVANLDRTADSYRLQLAGGFDFVTLPIDWRFIEPAEQKISFKPLDEWVSFLAKKRIAIKASPLLSSSAQSLPDWLFEYANDFESVRDLAHQHIKRVVGRYAGRIRTWCASCGLHADNALSLTFEQVMELTRMSAALVKRLEPDCTVTVDIIAPWGEYYADNPRSIPPMLYAEMVSQSGVNFDALGVQFHFGRGDTDMRLRDLFQVSSLLDRCGSYGRPVHVAAVEVPSQTPPEQTNGAGHWRDQWDDTTQAEWLDRFYRVALSRPFVESVCWGPLADTPDRTVPYAGLLRQNDTAKPAYKTLQKLRRKIENTRPG